MSTAALAREAEFVIAKEILVSADSHITEPNDLWDKGLPASLKDRAPKFPPPAGRRAKAGWL